MYTQTGAVTYCQTTLTAGGYHDWRLPTLIELVSILDYDGGNPLQSPFIATVLGSLWTSTFLTGAPLVNGVPQSGWYIASNGASAHDVSTSAYLVKCVR